MAWQFGERITNWIKNIFIDGIESHLSTSIEHMDEHIQEAGERLGESPSEFLPEAYNIIRDISTGIIMPVAGIVLTFVCTIELIQLIIDRNNLNDIDTWIFFKWIFKTTIVILVVANSFTIIMGIFDVIQSIIQSTAVQIEDELSLSDDFYDNLATALSDYKVGRLIGLFLETWLIRFGTWVMWLIIQVIVYGRMLEIYLLTSLAPIPLATLGNREQGQMGQNYLRSLIALGFQGVLIMVCLAIYYGVLKQMINTASDVSVTMGSFILWTLVLIFALTKTGNLSKSIFNAH